MNPLLVGPLFDVIKQVLGGLGIDPEAKARAQQQAFDVLTKGDFEGNAQLQLALAQLGVNKAEAESPGIFKGGWRPAAGWVCVGALALQFLIAPVAVWVAQLAQRSVPPFPNLDNMLWELLFGLLGLGALRTVERVKGKA